LFLKIAGGKYKMAIEVAHYMRPIITQINGSLSGLRTNLERERERERERESNTSIACKFL